MCDGQWQIWQEADNEGIEAVTTEDNSCLQAEELLGRDIVISSVYPEEGGEN